MGRTAGASGIVVAGVERLEDALAGDLARSHDMVVSIPTGDGDLAVVGNPIRFPGEPTRYGPPPLLGEHTAALLGARE